ICIDQVIDPGHIGRTNYERAALIRIAFEADDATSNDIKAINENEAAQRRIVTRLVDREQSGYSYHDLSKVVALDLCCCTGGKAIEIDDFFDRPDSRDRFDSA